MPGIAFTGGGGADDQTAAEVPIIDTGGHFIATEVEGALQELGARTGGGTPATTVTSETAFGVAPAVGIGTSYARNDHTHGSPTNPVTAHEGAADPHAGYRLESAAITATEVTNTPAGAIAATNVQAAINELDKEKIHAAIGAGLFGAPVPPYLVVANSVVVTTNASGVATVLFATPFTEGVTSVVVTPGDDAGNPGSVQPLATTLTLSGVNVKVFTPSGVVVASTTLRLNYIAIGS